MYHLPDVLHNFTHMNECWNHGWKCIRMVFSLIFFKLQCDMQLVKPKMKNVVQGFDLSNSNLTMWNLHISIYTWHVNQRDLFCYSCVRNGHVVYTCVDWSTANTIRCNLRLRCVPSVIFDLFIFMRKFPSAGSHGQDCLSTRVFETNETLLHFTLWERCARDSAKTT